MTLDLLRRAYWDIAEDWPKALQIVLVPWLSVKFLIFASNYFFVGSAWASNEAIIALPPESSYHIVAFVLSLIEVMVAVWIAVAWHRYILLKEQPISHLPRWFGKLNWRYLGRLVLVSVLSIVPFFALVFIHFQISGTAPDFSQIPHTSGMRAVTLSLLLLVGCITSSYVLLRVGAVLPGVASEADTSIGGVWSLTKKSNTEIAYCSVVLGLAVAIVVVTNHMFAGFDAVTIVLAAVSGFISLLSLSLLTTIFAQIAGNRGT